ncbi:PREDICTED: membrane magnesium transporter 1 isoform X1 [Dipodomys ordii]|uniref:Membrane magnesium transporter 1 isoform X1 n=1 Tax=Dipodomys ordii TaxID=10020 RepID=A0A1S3FAP8_DIPOR|nr:PREDICTED: membrane magnesium transporter 1 isoform X1 [Dipodomys ordii]
MAPSLWKGLVGIGLFALAHAAFSAAQHRSYMRLTEKEDESLPIDIVLQTLLAFAVTCYGIVHIAGEFKDMDATSELKNKPLKCACAASFPLRRRALECPTRGNTCHHPAILEVLVDSLQETMADEANKNLGRPETEENPANEDMFIPPPPKRKCTEVLPSKNELANEGESCAETLAKKEKEAYEKIFQVFDKEPGTLEMTRELFENAIKEAIRFKC